MSTHRVRSPAHSGTLNEDYAAINNNNNTVTTGGASADVSAADLPAKYAAAGGAASSSIDAGSSSGNNGGGGSSSSASHTPAATATATLVRRILAAAFTLGMCYAFMGPDLSQLFQYHPIGYTVSFVALMPEIISASNAVRRQRSVADRERYIDRHMYLSLCMKFLSLIGFIAITVNKNHKGKRHYTTWHGQLGLLTMTILAVQVVLGFVYHFRCGGALAMSTIVRLRKVHKYLGIALLVVGSATMWLGMQTHFFQKNVTNSVIGTFVLGAITATLSGMAYKYE